MDTIIHECEVLVPGVCDAKLLESFKRLHKTRHARGSARLLGAGDCFHACALFACATARARARDTHTHTHTHTLSLSHQGSPCVAVSGMKRKVLMRRGTLDSSVPAKRTRLA